MLEVGIGYKSLEFNPRPYTQSHTPTVVQGGGGGGWTPLDMLQYFKTILFSVGSL